MGIFLGSEGACAREILWFFRSAGDGVDFCPARQNFVCGFNGGWVISTIRDEAGAPREGLGSGMD